MAIQNTIESVLLVSRCCSPIDSKYHVSFPFSSILLHQRRPTRILYKQASVNNPKKRDLPASDVLDDPKVEGTEDDDNEEAEGLVVNEEAEDQVTGEGKQFKAEMEHAVAWVGRAFQETRHKLLLLFAKLSSWQALPWSHHLALSC